MTRLPVRTLCALGTAAALLAPMAALAGDIIVTPPTVFRLTPPSALFSFNDATPPIIARFFRGQKFDFAATLIPAAGQTITSAEFRVDGALVNVPVTLTAADASTYTGNTTFPANTKQAALRAYSNSTPGIHTFTVTGYQSDGGQVVASGNFEVVGFENLGRKAKNVIFMFGDGFGIAHRTAARIMGQGVQMGKANAKMEIDAMPNVAIVNTHSLNSIVTDSAPGAACYSTGNKSNNNQEGVFPDDTLAKFDNPRVEFMASYLSRTQGKTLGIVTTADVFDATPAAFAIHTQDRGAGSGICDQYIDEGVTNRGLRVLLGGGRKWFLPAGTTGSARTTSTDYTLPSDITSRWGVPAGAVDTTRNLISDFTTGAGFTYVANANELTNAPANTTRLLGLFSFSNMNVAKDKVDGRRGATTVASDYGFPDQPMLDEMTSKALQVLSKNNNGFTLMVEAASIDKQAHNMDSERWILDTLEFDRAVGVARTFAANNPDTLVVVLADHECAGVNIIGASMVSNVQLTSRAAANLGTNSGGLRNGVVGNYEAAGFPVYTIAADGYPTTTDPDYKMLIGYAGNSDRYEDWLTNAKPLRDSQQNVSGTPYASIQSGLPADPGRRDVTGGYWVTGQVEGSSAVHTASDIPVYAEGRGSNLFRGTMDNTDVFFLVMQAVVGGTPKTN
jgi:alkaline phosphatase